MIRWMTLSLFLFTMAAYSQHMDVDITVGPDQCGECHKSEMAVWKETKHYKSFFELTRSEEARAIAQKMGIKRIKRESDCLNCHFTSLPEEGVIKPVAGTSCESCHGAAANWIDIHNDYGGKDVKKEQESAEHREQRIANAKANGMLRPENLYKVAQNCYQCHSVPNEKLVNVGGHTAGSQFELVSWSQGEIRHNFLHSQSGEQNLPASTERKRLMLAVGQALDLEYGLRGLALATEKADYAIAMAKRCQLAMARIKKLHEAQPIDEFKAMLEIAEAAELKLNHRDALTQAADQVAKLGQQLSSKYDGSTLAGLDGLMPDESKFKGKPAL